MSKLIDWGKYQIGFEEAKRIANGTSTAQSNSDLAVRVAALALEVGGITLNAYRAYHGDTSHTHKTPLEMQIVNIEVAKYVWHVLCKYGDRWLSTSNQIDTTNSALNILKS